MAVAALCAAGFNLARTDPLPWFEAWSERLEARAEELGIRLVETDEVYAMSEEGATLIFDARPGPDYDTGHLPMALSLPSEEFDLFIGDYLGLLYPEQAILVYCSGSACDESVLLSQSLIDMGFTNIALYAGGVKAWVETGHELEGAR
jgi:rhodanese-related sulfurtransferase